MDAEWICADEWHLTVHGFSSLAVQEVVPGAVVKVQFREEFPLVGLLDGERDWGCAGRLFEQFGLQREAGVNLWLLEPCSAAGDWALEHVDDLLTADQVDAFCVAHGEGDGLWDGWCTGDDGKRRVMTSAERVVAAAERCDDGRDVSVAAACLLAGWRPRVGSQPWGWPFVSAAEGWQAIRASFEPAETLTSSAVRWVPPATPAPMAFSLTAPFGGPRLVVHGRPGAWAGIAQVRNRPLSEKEMRMEVDAEQVVAWAERAVRERSSPANDLCPVDRPSHLGGHLVDQIPLFGGRLSVVSGRQLAPVWEVVAEVLQSPVRYRKRRDLMLRAEALQVRGRAGMDDARLRSEVTGRARPIADEFGVGAMFLQFKSIAGPDVDVDPGAAEAVMTRAVNMFAHDGFERVSQRLSSLKETQRWEGFLPVNPFAGVQVVSSQLDPDLAELNDDIPF